MLKVLDFQLVQPTVLTFMARYLEISNLDSSMEQVECMSRVSHLPPCRKSNFSPFSFLLSQYLGELALVDAEPFSKYLPSVIASSALCLSRHALGLNAWVCGMGLNACICGLGINAWVCGMGLNAWVYGLGINAWVYGLGINECVCELGLNECVCELGLIEWVCGLGLIEWVCGLGLIEWVCGLGLIEWVCGLFTVHSKA